MLRIFVMLKRGYNIKEIYIEYFIKSERKEHICYVDNLSYIKFKNKHIQTRYNVLGHWALSHTIRSCLELLSLSELVRPGALKK